MSQKTAVVAIGGNSLIADSQHQTVADQYTAVVKTCEHLVDMLELGWRVVITHGNGPQVGFILRRSELAARELHEVPMDSCGADTQGAIGYMLQKALRNELRRRGQPDRRPVTIITQVLVDPTDPAFNKPSKPIGSFMDEKTASRRRKQGWQMIEDAGRGWRRIVPSPMPQRIVELDAIRHLVEQNFIVIAVGGGGIPVMQAEDGDIVGVEAVIDKDYASALLASGLGADLLLISTAVEKVALNYGRPDVKWLDQLTLAEAREHLAAGQFPPGSMGPKIRAAISFLEAGGEAVLITNPESIARAVQGQTGTRIRHALPPTLLDPTVPRLAKPIL